MPKVLLAVPGESVAVTTVDGGVEAISELIGGPLECVRLERGLTLYCNGEGNARELPVNPHFNQGMIRGPFVIAKGEASSGVNFGIDESEVRSIVDTYIRTE